MQFLKDLGYISFLKDLGHIAGSEFDEGDEPVIQTRVLTRIQGGENYRWSWKWLLFLRMIIVGENDESHSVVSMNLR